MLGFNLSPEALPDSRQRFNPRCQPPWTDDDSRRKLNEAANQNRARVASSWKASQKAERDGQQAEQSAKTEANGEKPDRPKRSKRKKDGSKPDAAILDPAKAASVYLETGKADGIYRLRFWRGGYWLYSSGRYAERLPSEIVAYLVQHLNQKCSRLTTGIVANVVQQLRTQAILSSSIEQPAWIEGNQEWQPADILVAKNMMIHLPSVLSGEEFSKPLTPRFFTGSALDYPFDTNAPIPTAWLTFLGQLWGDDAESIDALQEWFGYTLTVDTSQQKILMLIGPTHSAGVIARINRGLIGAANVAGPTLASLREPISACGRCWENRSRSFPTHGSAAKLIRRSWSNGSCLHLGRGHLDGRSEDARSRDGQVADANHATVQRTHDFGDSSGAAYPADSSCCSLTESFYGREDKALTTRLLAELPGILLWSIEGWRRLRRERGFFRANRNRPTTWPNNCAT